MNLKIKITLIIPLLILLLSSSHFIAKDLKLLKEKTFEVSDGQMLTVKTDVGDIIIKSWEEDELLIKIYGDSDAKRKMEFTFDKDETGVFVYGEKEGGKLFSWFSSIDLKYEIKVPRTFDLDLKSSGGDLVATNVDGEFLLKTSGGDIYGKNLVGNMEGSTSGGDVTLVGFTGNSELSTSGGDIKVDVEKGDVYANTSGGDITLSVSNGEVKAKTSGGDIFLDYSGENYGISLITSGGDIDAKLPSGLNADVELKTSGGDLETNFSKNKMSKISKTKLIGKFNRGGRQIISKTSGGDITITEK